MLHLNILLCPTAHTCVTNSQRLSPQVKGTCVCGFHRCHQISLCKTVPFCKHLAWIRAAGSKHVIEHGRWPQGDALAGETWGWWTPAPPFSLRIPGSLSSPVFCLTVSLLIALQEALCIRDISTLSVTFIKLLFLRLMRNAP